LQMIANEVTVLLDKACEIFINEITVRAFLVANSMNRRTVNTSDVAMAISQSDMFDFLIDIVPAEQLAPENDSAGNLPAASTSTSPTSIPKSSTSTRKRRPTMPELHEETNSVESIVSTPLPSAPPPLPPKKKPKNTRVNRNLLPEEVAVPIPDTELIKREPSPEFAAPRNSPHQRLLAVPIPDSELIPPRPSEPTWEMAVPITSNDHQRSASGTGRTWEMAVPITESSSHQRSRAPNWEMAVPISNDPTSGSSHHPSQKRRRDWDLAVPILDEDAENSDHPSFEQMSVLKRKPLPSPGASSYDGYQCQSNYQAPATNQRNWELAIPISDHEPGPSRQDGQVISSNTHSRYTSSRLPPVPIDPALFGLASSAQLNPHLPPHPDDPPHISIKQEE